MERSSEFAEGYGACDRGISRTRNPYYKPIKTNEDGKKFDDWREGWNKRFYHEDMLSEP